jgi:hypothetical protein
MEHLTKIAQLNKYETDLYFLTLSQHMNTDCLLIYVFFYRLLRVAILKLWCKSTTSKQKQFCDHVPHIIINPGKLSRISKQYHISQQICNSV